MFWSNHRATHNASRRRNRRSVRGIFESLEDRRLLTTTYNVTTTLDVIDPNDGKLSLREAIEAANSNSGADIIVLKTGNYKITIPGAGEDDNQTGDFDIIDSVTIKAASRAKPVIDGNGFDRVFDVPENHDNISLEFDGLTIRGGNTDSNGGGVHTESIGVSLKFVDTTVTNNQAEGNGGGVSSNGGPITLLRSHVDNNSAQDDGGGIWQSGNGFGDLTLTKSTVNSNVAADSGGGIFSGSEDTFTATGSQIKNNQAFSGKGGGALLEAATTLIFDSTTVSGNTATDDGGGVNASSAQTTTIRNNSLFSNNYSDDIGGGFNGGGDIIVTKSSFIHNTARAGGGGINQDNDGDITITGSTFSKNVSVFEVGGAIWTAGSGTFEVDDSKFTYNTSGTGSDNNGEGGGGAINTAIPITIRRSTFDHNTSATEAGAIGSSANLEVIDCTFTYNKSNGGEGGGAISTDDSDATITHCVFDNNLAAGTEGDGGGFYADEAGTVTITDSTFSRNSSGGEGGGFFVDGETLRMSGTTVNDNNAHAAGGGVSLHLTGVNDNAYPGDLGPGSLIINSTIGANGTAGNGGGIYFNGEGGADLTIINATIVFNAANQGGGVFHDTDGNLHVGNTIIAKNIAPTGPDVFGDFDDLEHNLIYSLADSTGFTNGSPNIIAQDPKLGPLANNGGPTKTYALLQGSPAINAADDTLAPDQDQRKVSRPQPANGDSDIGAYEFKAKGGGGFRRLV